jgi:hypothetical protein
LTEVTCFIAVASLSLKCSDAAVKPRDVRGDRVLEARRREKPFVAISP